METFPLQRPVEGIVGIIARLWCEYDASCPFRSIKLLYLVVTCVLDPDSGSAPGACRPRTFEYAPTHYEWSWWLSR